MPKEKKEATKYEVKFNLKILKKGADVFGSERSEVKFNFQECVPYGTDPFNYLRSRLREEIKRHESVTELDWEKPEEAGEEL